MYKIRHVLRMIDLKNINSKLIQFEGKSKFNFTKPEVKGEPKITNEHIKNNKEVRELLGKSGIKPEHLPAEEDIKNLERRVKSSDKELSKKKLGKNKKDK